MVAGGGVLDEVDARRWRARNRSNQRPGGWTLESHPVTKMRDLMQEDVERGTRAGVDIGESDMVSKCAPLLEKLSAHVVEEKSLTALESVAACVAGVAGRLAKESSELNGQMTAIGKHDKKSMDQLTKVTAPGGETVKHWADDLVEVAAQPRQVVASRQASEAPLALQAQPAASSLGGAGVVPTWRVTSGWHKRVGAD